MATSKPPPLAALIRAAIAAARAAHVDEPTIEYCGRRYGETELRQLQADGNLQSLGALAAGVPHYLSALDHARAPAFGPPNHLMIIEGTTWGDDLPLETEYLLPAGWTHKRICYVFEEQARSHG